ncbi:ABC transporter substrate-binding protein [Roseomonas sp. AR75]|uniref:ABC transporter substrate-binding protein n=1 Tax=Roseomonas sp. AR75 TaxID=2562311 RepID=UPI001485750B|nr:ABC transporter substrate-binding protein [Roseomonas sp. AR75]
MQRRPLLAFALAAPALARGANAQPARVLRVVAPWEIGGLDPARSGYVFQRMQIAETLVGTDERGALVPSLARGWRLLDDRVTWRIALRAGATFHDGTPVTAAAVAESLRRARGGPGPLAQVPIEGIAAEAGEVVLRTARPFLSLPAFLAHSSTVILAPAAYDAGGAVRAIIGTGPYRLTDLLAPQRLDAERFAGWWGVAPAIERVSYLAVTRGETRAAMAEAGQAEIVTTLAPETVARLRRNARLSVEVVPIPRTRAVKLNASLPMFADVRTRRAFSLAIDRAGIATALLRSPESAATQLFPPGLGDWYDADLPPLRRDLAEARRLLDEAGWRPGPDGIRAKDGKTFRATLRTFSDRPELPGVATAMQAQLREAGIDLQVAVMNSGEIPAGHRDGTLEAALFARNFSLVPDPIGTLLQDFGPQGGDWGAMGWSDPALVAAMERLTAEPDPATQTQLRRRIAAILQAELPVIPVAWYDYPVAFSRRVAGGSVDPLELSYRIAGMRWAD